MSLKDLSQKVVLDTLNDPKMRKQLDEIEPLGKRLCINDSIYFHFIDYNSNIDPYDQITTIKKHRDELNQLKEIKDTDFMERYGLPLNKKTTDLEASPQVFNDFMICFENITHQKYPIEIAYYLSLCNDEFIKRYTDSLIRQSYKSIEDCLQKSIITQELYNQIIKRRQVELDMEQQEYLGTYSYTQNNTNLTIDDTLEYSFRSKILICLKRYCGMGWTLRLSCFLNIKNSDKKWFVHMYDGSSGIDCNNNYNQLINLKHTDKRIKLMTFNEALDLINQPRNPEDFMYDPNILWLYK